ncbi:MAG: ABC transporter permease [Cyclobacteriaceae bacterium]
MSSHPPKYFLRFFRWFCHPRLQKPIEGDLMELYEERVKEMGKKKADQKFRRDVLELFRRDIIKPADGTYRLNNYGMLKSYVKVGIRNILKYKTFSFINIFGLSVAMTVGLLIMQILYDQSQYDQFHTKKERIFRVLSKQEKSLTPNAKCPRPLASTLEKGYPIIEEFVRLIPTVGGDAVNVGEDKNAELRGFFADNSFFKIFDFELEKGDKYSALSEPNSMIITAEKAYLLFNDQNPIGKTVQFSDRGLEHLDFSLGIESANIPQDWGTFTISGVIDLSKYKSHLTFDVLASSSTIPRLVQEKFRTDHSENWRNYSNSYTYVLLKENSTEGDLQAAIDDIVEKEYRDFEQLAELSLPVQRLSEITPGEFIGAPITLRLPIQAYYFLGLLTLIILFSACLNYTNLSIARALTRAKEIGVRKVNGASRKNLISQFLAEALITSFMALIVSNIFLLFLKPALNGLWVSQLLTFNLETNLTIYGFFVGFSLIIGLSAGFYPALLLSKFNPLDTLKKFNPGNSGKIRLRQILSVTQFVFSLLFIITAILIGKQFQHYSDFEYNFNTDNVVNIPIQGNDYQLLVNELKTLPEVIEVSACEMIPSLPNIKTVNVRAMEDDEGISSVYHSVDLNFIDNMGLKLIAGRNFISSSASGNELIIDQTMAQKLRFPSEAAAVGQTVKVHGNQVMEIVGVIANFEFKTPVDDGNGPVVFWSNPDQFNYLNVRVSSNDWPVVIGVLEGKWKDIDPIHPFKFNVYNDQLLQSNLWLSDLASIIGFISVLAIIISCLGLLGMAVYTSERRQKEVGIRKVLGASLKNLTFLLSWSFVKVLLISILFAAPLSYFINILWLESLPNRVQFGLGTILMGSTVLMLIGLLTIGSQIFSVSRRNPIESLKDE